MAQFDVMVLGGVSRTETVEADTWQDAVTQAMEGDAATVNLCHQCNDQWEPDGETRAYNVTDSTGRVVALANASTGELIQAG